MNRISGKRVTIKVLDASASLQYHIRNRMARLLKLYPNISNSVDFEFTKSSEWTEIPEVDQQYFRDRMTGPGFYIFDLTTGGMQVLPFPADYEAINNFINSYFNLDMNSPEAAVEPAQDTGTGGMSGMTIALLGVGLWLLFK